MTTREREKDFPVAGSGIIIKDKDHLRGQLTAYLMGGEHDYFNGREALEYAKKLISFRVSPEQLEFLITKQKKTPKEAVTFLEDSSNRLRLIAQMEASKGTVLPEYLHN